MVSESNWSLGKTLIVGTVGVLVFIFSLGLFEVYVAPELARMTSFAVAQDLAIVCVQILTLLAVYAVARAIVVKGARQFLESISWRWDGYRPVLASAAMGILLASFVQLAGAATLWRPGIHTAPHTGHLLSFLLAIFIAQPISEEVYFRGVLYAGLSRTLGAIAAIWSVTFLFVLGHPQHHWIVLPVSILLAIVRLRTNSVANCVALHMAYNLGVSLLVIT